MNKSEYAHLLANICQGQFDFIHDLRQHLIESILTTNDHETHLFNLRARQTNQRIASGHLLITPSVTGTKISSNVLDFRPSFWRTKGGERAEITVGSTNRKTRNRTLMVAAEEGVMMAKFSSQLS